ncbi:hypothetical protein F511_36413 [Dorcoceras hygrometricum]|uniref:Uncharacterized protein n=1 Tax=Dorcoceras hygrometricum TaxID=472368 RepID=A0A2Z7BB36_9LAMI|nr:hypothetical protein F511_36413 [Dorcoceras hygrometricum]
MLRYALLCSVPNSVKYVYIFVVCSNGIPHLLSVSPDTHPLLLHPDKNEEQVKKKNKNNFGAGEDSVSVDDSDFNSVNRFEIPMEMTPSAPRTRAAAALRMKQITLDNQGRTIRCLRAQLATERRGLATMKKELEDTQVALEASHKKFQARIHEAEDSMQAQHVIIEALVDEKDSLLQTIQGLQEANNAPAPFDGE